MSRARFSVEEASSLVPLLEREVGGLLRWRQLADRAADALGEQGAAAALELGWAPEGQEGEVMRLRKATAELIAAIERINALGCIIEDLEAGIVDFPSEREGQPVRLCWQIGEPRVVYFHEEGGPRRLLREGAVVELVRH